VFPCPGRDAGSRPDTISAAQPKQYTEKGSGNVLSRVGTEDLQNGNVCDLFGCHEFHLVDVGDGLELSAGEEAVLSGVHNGKLQFPWLTRIVPKWFEVVEAWSGIESVAHSLGLRLIEDVGFIGGPLVAGPLAALDLPDLPASDHLIVDVPVAHHGGRFQLLDDGGPGCSGHEEEEARMGEGHSILAHESGAGPVLSMDAGDVESQPSGPRGSDLEIDPCSTLFERAMKDAHVRDQLGHGCGDEELFHILKEVDPSSSKEIPSRSP
jgi:hypothetical protein